MRRMRALVLAALLCLGLCATAVAAPPPPPPNDTLDNAQELGSPPASANGTTVGSTRSFPDDRISGCEPNSDNGSVWYRFTTPQAGRYIVSMRSNQDRFDATLNVIRQRRSQLEPVDCDSTDDSGEASVAFQADAGAAYYIRIATQTDARDGTFSVRVEPSRVPPPSPPGRHLPVVGVTNRVQRVFNPSDAWSLRMRQGQPYRIDLSAPDCLGVDLYPPGTTDFESDSPVASRGCGGYFVFTPGPDETGTYSIVVRANGSVRTPVSYRLDAGPAGRDDLAPGVYLRNYQRKRAGLNSFRADGLDLYAFDVRHLSNVDLRLNAPGGAHVDLQLLGQRGRTLACACGGQGPEALRVALHAGRYFFAVRSEQGAGFRYTVQRVARAITHCFIRADHQVEEGLQPGQTAVLSTYLRGASRGPVTFFEQKFDPLQGWRFVRRFRTRASGGVASIAFRPPTRGSYRFRAEYAGNAGASPSRTAFAYLDVQGPLRG